MKQRLLIFLLATCLPSWATTYYVLAGGTGTHNGTDWGNANCTIPDPLSAGDVVYIGNSGGNLADITTGCPGELTHTFTGSGTSGSHITIKAATGTDHGTGTGWASSMGVDVSPKITWSNSFTPGDNSGKLHPAFWQFCGNYYDVNGQVGTSDTTGTYGFYFRSAGRMYGFIKIETHACSDTSMQNINISYVELDGVNANSTNWPSSPINSGANGWYTGSLLSTVASASNITFSYTFTHDIFGPLSSAGNTVGLTISNSWIESNYSCGADATPSCNEHSNGIDTQAPNNNAKFPGIQNLTVYDSVFKNVEDTFIHCLNGICDGWKIYNNIFYYDNNWDTRCATNNTGGNHADFCANLASIADNTPGGLITNGVFYGNTIAGVHKAPAGAPGAADDAGLIVQITGSTGNVAKNNLWWNCTGGDLYYDGSGGHATNMTHDYNTWLNTPFEGSTALAAHESQTNTGSSNPFVNQYSDFHLTSETVDPHLNDGLTLSSPYDLDFAGLTRGADGTWERGVYEFNPAAPPTSPTGLQATVH